MLSVNIVANRDDLTATALIGLVVDNKDHLETIMANLRKVDSVMDVSRAIK